MGDAPSPCPSPFGRAFLLSIEVFDFSSEMLRVSALFVLLCAASLPLGECRSESNPSFLLAAGVSAASEQCLAAAGSSVSLSSCAEAVAAGGGSDIWSFSNGQLVSAASTKCLTLLGGDATDGGHVGLVDCDGAAKTAGSQWEVWPRSPVRVFLFAFLLCALFGGRCLVVGS